MLFLCDSKFCAKVQLNLEKTRNQPTIFFILNTIKTLWVSAYSFRFCTPTFLSIPFASSHFTSRNPSKKALGKMNFFSPRANLTWMNFSFMLTMMPFPNFLWRTLLPVSSVSKSSFRLSSACAGFDGSVGEARVAGDDDSFGFLVGMSLTQLSFFSTGSVGVVYEL